jgi:hypothetical protein
VLQRRRRNLHLPSSSEVRPRYRRGLRWAAMKYGNFNSSRRQNGDVSGSDWRLRQRQR